MKKVLAISSVLLGVVFLAGCGQQPVSQTQPAVPAPVAQQPAQPATNQQSNNNAISPEKVVQNFYSWYLDYEKKEVSKPEAERGNLTVPQIVMKSGMTTSNFSLNFSKNKSIGNVDGVVCGQELPENIKYGNAVVSGDMASEDIMAQWDSVPSSVPAKIKVLLKKINSEWKIDNIICQ